MASKVQKNPRQQASDAAMVPITFAFFMLTLSILAYELVGKRYRTIGGFRVIYPLLPYAIIVFGLGLLLCGFGILKAKGRLRTVCGYALLPMTLAALSCVVLRLTWVDYLTALLFIHILVYGLIMIYYLYSWEFTLFSFVTALAAMVFNRISVGTSPLRLAAKAVGLTVFLALVVFITVRASRNKGVLKFSHLQVQLFTRRSTPAILYFICAVWLVCLIACILLGSGFAYYCQFAAIALELIAAVYYTFQLK